jgi:putative transposase
LGNPLRVRLTPGQRADSQQVLALLDGIDPQAVIADKAYDTNALIGQLADRGVEVVIPPKRSRLHPRGYDKNLYADRNKIERFFNHLKAYRRIATRYDKTASSFLAFVHVACALLWLR